MDDQDSEWVRRGATLTDGTATKEHGLTREQIYGAARAGRLQYREASIYSNPCLRLLRREVEDLVRSEQGDGELRERKARTELAHLERELRRLKRQVAELEERKAQLANELAAPRPTHPPNRRARPRRSRA